MEKQILFENKLYSDFDEIAEVVGKTRSAVIKAFADNNPGRLRKRKSIPVEWNGQEFSSLYQLAKHVGYSKQYVSRMYNAGKLHLLKKRDDKD